MITNKCYFQANKVISRPTSSKSSTHHVNDSNRFDVSSEGPQ
jgi:hypothetical protein